MRRRSICSLERCGLGAVDLQLQMEMEERRMEATDAGDAERRPREEEWRAAMVALGEVRLVLVRRWRQREDAWRARAEEREERRHQLVAALLAKLGGGDTSQSIHPSARTHQSFLVRIKARRCFINSQLTLQLI